MQRVGDNSDKSLTNSNTHKKEIFVKFSVFISDTW